MYPFDSLFSNNASDNAFEQGETNIWRLGGSSSNGSTEDPLFTAFGSYGWWEPFTRDTVVPSDITLGDLNDFLSGIFDSTHPCTFESKTTIRKPATNMMQQALKTLSPALEEDFGWLSEFESLASYHSTIDELLGPASESTTVTEVLRASTLEPLASSSARQSQTLTQVYQTPTVVESPHISQSTTNHSDTAATAVSTSTSASYQVSNSPTNNTNNTVNATPTRNNTSARHQARNTANEIVHSVRPGDVILGQGTTKEMNKHEGNNHLKRLIQNCRAEYNCSSTSKRRKTEISEGIVAVIHRGGGRFLKPLEDPTGSSSVTKYEELNKIEARGNVSSKFRNTRKPNTRR